ncbi:MAG: glycerate 2-kinase [Gaiellaceae bacterium]|jgi:glycerate kinase|nr:glycerate 2-kinase [Gaiellaceae bacterium]
MIVVCAPDKFRGSLESEEAAAALAEGVRAAGCEAVCHPLADGGEGTMELIRRARAGRRLEIAAADALGRTRPAAIAMLDDGTAVVEVAEAIGHVPPQERDVPAASSAGAGELLLGALDAGATRIVVGLGGSATVDGGLGLLRALGCRLRDADGRELAGSGADLARVVAIDRSGLDPRLAATPIVLALDVSSPLTGPAGAAAVFGPQKGATPQQVVELDAGLLRLAPLLGEAAEIEGAGAAGGLGAALAWLGSEPRRGADLVMEETRFADVLAGAGCCLTGEGSVDRQTVTGKTVARVVVACHASGVPVGVVGGAVDPAAADALYALGATAVLAAGRGPATLEQALEQARANVSATARALCGMLRA